MKHAIDTPIDNAELARLFSEIADLLDVKGDNAFKIRAYRAAADTIAPCAEPVVGMNEDQLRTLPGIGKDLAAKIREIAETGTCAYHQDLLQQFPPTILDLLRLQGVGPKTVALLYSALHIGSVEELAAAAREGRLRGVKGFGPKKEALILKAIEEREKDAGRHLLSETAATAAEIVAYLQERVPGVECFPVGSLRRTCETCGDIDLLAIGDAPALMDLFVSHPKVERVLGHGETKSSVRLKTGFQVDLRLVLPESRGAAMQYFTGSKAHVVAVRDRALHLGLTLNEYGLTRLDDHTRVAGATEEGIYEALGLRWIAPELRENRGELEAAADDRLPRLITEADLLGDLHMHTTATDGRDTLEAMAEVAHRAGRRYIAITDHSKALAMANGLDEHRALAHAAQVRALNGRFEGLTLLAGIECDILSDGRLDLAEDCLAQLDFVIASVHSHFNQEPAQMTDRLLTAIACPWVDVLGHPTGRLLLRREPLRMDLEQVTAAAAQHGVAMEINAQADRLDLNDQHARLARDRGVRIVISTDAHSAQGLGNMHWGVQTARRAWLSPDDVLNTRTIDALRPLLRRNRTN